MDVDSPSSSLVPRPLGLGDIWEARDRIRNRVWHTPLVYSQAPSERAGCQVYLKMECWQVCGCFKVRGAVNMVTALAPEERERGLVTASSGNHGIALAYAASLFPAVEPSAAPGAYLSFREGRPCEQIELRPTLADGLSGGFAPLAWEVSHDLIQAAVLVEDHEIAYAMRVLQEAEQLMVEGAASVGLAALLHGKVDLKGERVVLVLTSRNIDTARYNRVVAQREVDAR